MPPTNMKKKDEEKILWHGPVERISPSAPGKSQLKLPDRASSLPVPPPSMTVSLDQEQILVSRLNLPIILRDGDTNFY